MSVKLTIEITALLILDDSTEKKCRLGKEKTARTETKLGRYIFCVTKNCIFEKKWKLLLKTKTSLKMYYLVT